MNENKKEKIILAIHAHPDEWDVIGKQSEESVLSAEKALGITFPDEYRWFCKEFGSGGFGGQEIYGVGNGTDSAIPSVVFFNKEARIDGAPKDVLLVCNSGEWQYGIDLSSKTEFSVILWILGAPEQDQTREIVALSFFDFLLKWIDLVLTFNKEE